VDPAGGGSEGDYACAQVIERASGMQCAELQGHFTPAELAARVAELARQYNHALIAVERNNHGYGVLAPLTMNEGAQNVYYQGNQAGWLTSVASRPRMVENFAATLTHAPFLFSSTRLLEECRTFVRHADGSASAASGTHDDLVMAMAIALAVRAETAAGSRPKRAHVQVASLG
jgi:DNA-binding response OmpR family regulator